MTPDQRHYPVEFGPSDNRRLECSCGNPDPAHADGNRSSKNLTNRELYELRECLEADCDHLRCKARREIERLTRERDESERALESLQNRWASRPLSNPDLIAGNCRLREAIQKAVAAMELEGLWGACLEGLKNALSDEPGSAVETAANRPELTVNGHQLKWALDYLDGELDTELTLVVCDERKDSETGEPMPAGLYCYFSEYPEEGCLPLPVYPLPSELNCTTCGQPLDDHGGMGLPCPHSKAPSENGEGD